MDQVRHETWVTDTLCGRTMQYLCGCVDRRIPRGCTGSGPSYQEDTVSLHVLTSVVLVRSRCEQASTCGTRQHVKCLYFVVFRLEGALPYCLPLRLQSAAHAVEPTS